MPNFIHKPVMLAEVLTALNPQPGRRYADGTLGGGGHAAAILAASSPSGQVFGSDRDGAALAAASERLAEYGDRVQMHRGNFTELADWIEPASCAGVLLDLGVSSPQLDEAQRGFSFMQDGPLDMRMDDRQKLTAATLVNERSADELMKIFWEYGDESNGRRIAREIERARTARRIETTGQLAELVEKLVPRAGKKSHPATRVFQALRIAVNDEMGSLQQGLEAAWKILQPGGRLAVLTFHSLEDREVKVWMRRMARDYEVEGDVDVPLLRRPVPPQGTLVSRKAIQPGDEEVRDNPRARSTQLRVIEKI